MSDASMPNQATEPNQEVASSQQAQLYPCFVTLRKEK